MAAGETRAGQARLRTGRDRPENVRGAALDSHCDGPRRAHSIFVKADKPFVCLLVLRECDVDLPRITKYQFAESEFASKRDDSSMLCTQQWDIGAHMPLITCETGQKVAWER
jgi:hypothetical protein